MKLRLSDIYELQMGKTPARNTPAFWNGTNAWVSISDLTSSDKYISQTRECITDDAITRTGIKKVPKDTLLMSFKLSLGKVAITAADIYTNEAIMAFIDKKTHDVDIHYMYHYFQAIDWTIGTNKAVKGVTLNKIVLSEKVIELPPINIQHEIAERMDNLNAVTKNLQHQLTLLDELVKSRFIEMFGDPVTNPMGWERARLADKCEIVTGNTPSRKVKEYYGKDLEWIKSDNITEATTLTEATEYLSDEGAKVGRTVETGSILMTCIAGSLRSIANVAIVDRKVAFNQQINAIVPKKQNTYFMYEQFRLSKDYICSNINMALKGILSKGQLSEIEFVFPPLALQNEFAAFVEQADKSKLVLRQLLEKQQTLKAALMQEYFAVH